MDIRPIHTEADYKAALNEISALMDSDPDLGTPEGDRVDILATLVQAYEAKHVPMAAPDTLRRIRRIISALSAANVRGVRRMRAIITA